MTACTSVIALSGCGASAPRATESKKLARGQFALDRQRPLNIAHRGASAVAPENTLEAALRGLEAGADLWELDVHVCRDGELVVIHDDTLIRTTNVEEVFPDDPRAATKYRVADFDLAELRQLDAGSWFLTGTDLPGIDGQDREWFASGKVRIPTLREALTLTRDNGWAVNVEIKNVPSFYPGIAGKVAALVRELDMTRSVLISSFDHGVLREMKSVAPELSTAVLVSNRIIDIGRYTRETVGADYFHPSAKVLGADGVGYHAQPGTTSLFRADVEDARRAGLGVNVWTVNDHGDDELAKHLIDIGVTGVLSDNPASLEAFLDKSHGADEELPTAGQRKPFSTLY